MLTKTFHKPIAVSNQFAAGSATTGGKFVAQFPTIPFIPSKWIVRQITYDVNVALAGAATGPLLLSSPQLFGPIAIFNPGNSQAAAGQDQPLPFISAPQTEITNFNGTDLSGQAVDFVVTVAGGIVPGSPGVAAAPALTGILMFIIEAVRDGYIQVEIAEKKEKA